MRFELDVDGRRWTLAVGNAQLRDRGLRRYPVSIVVVDDEVLIGHLFIGSPHETRTVNGAFAVSSHTDAVSRTATPYADLIREWQRAEFERAVGASAGDALGWRRVHTEEDE